jgi:hypothetical protein
VNNFILATKKLTVVSHAISYAQINYQMSQCLHNPPLYQECGLTKPTSWISVLLEKPPIVQLLKNFPTFYRIQRFITRFTRAFHWSLS